MLLRLTRAGHLGPDPSTGPPTDPMMINDFSMQSPPVAIGYTPAPATRRRIRLSPLLGRPTLGGEFGLAEDKFHANLTL